MLSDLAKTLIILGLIILAVGVLLAVAARLPYLGRLPGDIYIQKKNFTFYFPLTTSILISILLSLFFWLWSRR